MRMTYYPDTDSLYIDLSAKPSVESHEVSPGVVIDYDADGGLTGIDVDQASQALDLNGVTLTGLPRDPDQTPA